MKLKELLPLQVKKEKEPISSLVRNLEKIRFNELDFLGETFDNPHILSQSIRGWKAIHYAAMNSDYRVTDYIADLYQKYELDISIGINSSKNGLLIGANAMDMAYANENPYTFLILYRRDIKPAFSANQGLFVLKKYHEEEPGALDMPFPDNPLTPCLFYSSRGFYKFYKLLSENEYEEKDQIISEFKDNLRYLLRYIWNSQQLSNSKESTILNSLDHTARDLVREERGAGFKFSGLEEIYFIPLFEALKIVKDNTAQISILRSNKFLTLIEKYLGQEDAVYDKNHVLIKEAQECDYTKIFKNPFELEKSFYQSYFDFQEIHKNISSKDMTMYQNFFQQFNAFLNYTKLNESIPQYNEKIEKRVKI